MYDVKGCWLSVKYFRLSLKLIFLLLGQNVKCPPGTYEVNIDNCFKLSTQSFSWDEANKYCKDNGGVLASIHDTREQELIKEKFMEIRHARGAWIGLIRYVAEEGLLYCFRST